MSSNLINFMILYFILSNGSSIIMLEKNKEEFNKIDKALDKNKEASDKSNEEESDSYVCPICLHELGKDFTEHKCGNKYHIECLHRWEVESKNHNCPVCREILYPNEISEYKY
ncbi:uncharacterized protein LOC126893582 isoform X6 [Daktulosphaira vitifoliae]|uniref:uncharacterized protein LOC126893582 isoform X5 n=1 Tax=Daktulosphaira vitifoliae TaxID=58002 RepID=UPI0021AAE606|nr:uncharacterized protein LOC126893582 isoform X5 [Daktulosphaira vitifoliae]XP_050519883.1 uncharacterized protein LOC126893582 isoform X6 [Daktulosphaira vitifoliae]